MILWSNRRRQEARLLLLRRSNRHPPHSTSSYTHDRVGDPEMLRSYVENAVLLRLSYYNLTPDAHGLHSIAG